MVNASGTSRPMKTRHFFGDALTAVSVNIMVNISAIVTYFYTDIMGFTAAAAGTVMLIANLADAFTDMGMGVLVDRTKSKHGKARPWLLYMALPSLVCIAALFAVPAGTDAGFVYAAVTNTLMLAVVYTAVAVPSSSLMSLETKDPHERSKMGIWRLIFAYAAGMAVSSLMVPATNLLGGGRNAWLTVGAFFGILSAVSLISAFLLVEERNRVKTPRIAAVKGMASLFRNKYWLIALAVNVLIQLIYAVGSAETYYAKYLLGDENLVAAIGLFRLVFAAAGFALSGLLIKRTGKRNLILAGMLVSIAGCLLRAVNPYHLAFNFTAIGLSTLGGIPVLAVIGAIIADTVEYGEWKTGTRTVGLAASASSFAGKLGSAVFAGAAGWLLSLSRYDGLLPVQTPEAVRMIIALNVYLPLVCYAAIFVLMLFYGLEKDYAAIVCELESGRGS